MSSAPTRQPLRPLDVGTRTGLVTWSNPTPGLWVLNYAHSFGGTIDRHGPRFSVTGSRGDGLGQFDTLTAAQHALLTHTRTASPIGCAAGGLSAPA